jgi:hypothetical protein
MASANVMTSAVVQCPRARFAKDGFVVLEKFLARGEPEGIRSEVDALLLTPRDPGCTRPHNTLLPLRWCDAIVNSLLDCERRVRAIRKAVGATDLRWVSGYVSIKDAASGPLWWHQDWWSWDHPVSFRRPAPQIAVMCYLDEASRERGALRLLPGSHHRRSALHAILPEAHTTAPEMLGANHPALCDDPDQVSVGVAAGDAVVIDYRLLHGTHANMSDLRRDCIILNFAPSWRELPEDIRAHLISHLAQPRADEASAAAAPPWASRLLPHFDGVRRDLRLNRYPPERFEIVD